MGARTGNIARRLRRRHGDDERGAELIEFALVVVLLITLLYGIITYGLILAAQSTITQAAADGARSGIVLGTATTTCHGHLSVPAAECTAADQAAADIGWMNQGTCVEKVDGGLIIAGTSTSMTCTATEAACPSNSGSINNTCLTVTVSYAYSASPLFPELPGLGVITPSTISSTNVLQLSTPSS